MLILVIEINMSSKFLKRVFFYFMLFTFFNASLHADDENSNQTSGIGIYIDQDLLVPFTNEDRDYTMGVAVEFFWAKDKGLYPLDGLVKTAGEWLGIEESDNDIIYSFMLGTLAYTPDDLADSQPIYNDRPYSSLIYLSNKRVRTDGKNALAAEVLLGLMGSKLPGEFQAAFHSMYRDVADLDPTEDPVEPKGWRHQISDGGELTLRLRLTNSRLQETLSIPNRFDVTTTMGLSLGFQTNANLGFAMRLGKLRSPFWSLPYDPINRGNFVPSKAEDEWYFWSAFNARFIGYDALLQGQFRHSDVKFSYDEIEHVVYDGGIGLTLGFDESQFTISANMKSSDLKLTTRKQVWGSINYLYYF